jgi:Tol biopolymer transport system component
MSALPLRLRSWRLVSHVRVGLLTLVAVAGLSAPAWAQVQTTERASTTAAGTQPGTDLPSSMSADGRFVAFESFEPGYVPSDTNGLSDIFVKDRLNNTIERVSVATPVGGVAAQSNGTSADPHISGDGRYVVFISNASNLAANDSNVASDTFLHDRITRVTRRVSVSSTGGQLTGGSAFGRLSADGRFLTFRASSADVLPGVPANQIYRVNLLTNAIELVSRNTAGQPGNGASWVSVLSADGRHIAFESQASNLDSRRPDTNGLQDVFVRDMTAGTTARVSVQTDGFQTLVGSPAVALASGPSISGNGRYVAFTAEAELKLVGSDNNFLLDVYVRDRDVDNDNVMDEAVDGLESQTVKTFRVSVDTANNDPDGHSSQPSISYDGRYVAFLSGASDLVSLQILSGFPHVFVRDLDTDRDGILDESGSTTTSLVSMSSGGDPSEGVQFAPRITPNGRFVSFASFGGLDAALADTNGLIDIYVRDLQYVALSILPGSNPALSGDGRYLAFQTTDALVGGDTNGASDIYVRNLNSDGVARLSVNSSGGEASSGSFNAAISHNGRFVVFESDAPNLVAGDGNGVRDVFLRDRDADGDGVYDESGGVVTLLVSRSVGGAIGSGASALPAISADGRFIAFASDAPNLVFNDTNALRDIFLLDRQQPVAAAALTRVSLTNTGGQSSGGASTNPKVSDNGRFVVFQSSATNLIAGDTNGVADIFARDRTASTTSRVSILSNGTQPDESSFEPAMSANGERVVYTSNSPMVGNDGNELPDVFGKPISAGTTGRDSVGTGGVEANGGSGGPAINSSATMVAFRSNAPNITPGLDTNFDDDVYVRDRTTNRVRLASAPTGAIPFRAFDPTLSATGRTIAFAVEPLDSFVTEAVRNGEISVSAADVTGLSIIVQAVGPSSLRIGPTRGPANATTDVTITGDGLTNTTRVSFAGAAGTNLRVNRDSVTVTAPSRGPGPVEIYVEIAGFQSTYVGTFTYDEASAPTCTISAQAPQANLGQGGGQSQVNVITPADCPWVAGETVEWLTVSDPGTGTGSGAFQVTAEPNNNPAARNASVMVSGVELSFSQAGTGCGEFTVEPLSRVRPLDRGAGEDLQVAINIGFGCPWTATSNVPWLTVSSGSGPGVVRYSVTENTTPFERDATLMVQNIAITVVQAGTPPAVDCTYTVTPDFVRVPFGVPTTAFTVATSNPTCTWSAHSDVSWMSPVSGETNTGAGAVVMGLQGNSSGNRRGTASIAGQSVTVEQVGALGESPVGFVDTPGDNATGISGAIPLTGWAVDDTGVTEVIICRVMVAADGPAAATNHPRCLKQIGQPNEAYVASALFIRGARPDIQAAYPTMAGNDRAGWGVMLLTNYLPGGGNGTFTLTFRARDGVDVGGTFTPGNVVELGRRTITVNNATAVRPFGTIDTPAQGERVSGTNYPNFGWALTPLPKAIPTNGSTIAVIVDGISIGNPSYNLFRSDIATLFPGFNNTSGAVGHMAIDTRVLANGIHTIAWVVTDNNGISEGLGSRYFEVANAGAPVAAAAARITALTDLPVSVSPVELQRGFERRRDRVTVDGQGTRHVVLRAMDIARLELGGSTGTPYEGYTVNAGRLESLPIGSSFDAGAGVFSWQLGPGFVGLYELYFVRTVDGRREGIPVRLVVRPHATAGSANALTIDALPASIAEGTTVTLSGSAVSGQTQGLRNVFVYAYPTDGSEPYFVGETRLEAAAVDPRQSFGGQFARTTFSIALASLSAGTYDLLVIGTSRVSSALDATAWVGPLAVR